MGSQQAAAKDVSVLLPSKGRAMSQLSNYPQFRNQLLPKLSLEDLDLLRTHL
jgi:hypothetical protein